MPRQRGEWELADAFVRARYRIAATGDGAALTFDHAATAPESPCELCELRELLPRGMWAIVTAANPWSAALSATENATRMTALAMELELRGVVASPMRNASARGDWEEPSFLVEGLPREDVLGLCWQFGQAAAVFGVGTRCGLLWTRSERWVVMAAMVAAG